MSRRNWTREETIIAFNVYCKIPFKKSNKSHPLIIKYAKIIGRSPSALNMKVGNFGRLDPELKAKGISGLVNGSKLEEEVWNEFHNDWDSLIFESEQLIAKRQKSKAKDLATIDVKDISSGYEKERTIKARVNQNFFRTTILATYEQKCCITGIRVPELLIASHIIPWSKNAKERLNPRNGLCLNALHDKAFDKGLISITLEGKLILSKSLRDQENPRTFEDFFLAYEDKRIFTPEKFAPKPEFLKYHQKHIFKT